MLINEKDIIGINKEVRRSGDFRNCNPNKKINKDI
jgi:hypothetical protein